MAVDCYFKSLFDAVFDGLQHLENHRWREVWFGAERKVEELDSVFVEVFRVVAKTRLVIKLVTTVWMFAKLLQTKDCTDAL